MLDLSDRCNLYVILNVISIYLPSEKQSSFQFRQPVYMNELKLPGKRKKNEPYITPEHRDNRHNWSC